MLKSNLLKDELISFAHNYVAVLVLRLNNTINSGLILQCKSLSDQKFNLVNVDWLDLSTLNKQKQQK